MRRLLLAVLAVAVVSIALSAADSLTLCSFKIKWLGDSDKTAYEALGQVLSNYDVIVIQGIIAPPYPGTFPSGDPYEPDPEVTAFFDEMTKVRGYEYVLSEEDTGMQPVNRLNTSRTEWFAVFYDPEKLEVAPGLPKTFLADDVTANAVFDRVPYASSLRYLNTGYDFVLISVNLHAGATAADKQKRQVELEAIADWIDSQPSEEEHYVVLGDMNFQDCSEIAEIVPEGLRYLNPGVDGVCHGTDTTLGTKHPYDNVLYTRQARVDVIFGLRVIDLVSGLEAIWNPFGEPFEDAYEDLDFVGQISDHNPVIFKLQVASGDWD